jgi:hypothetical protein
VRLEPRPFAAAAVLVIDRHVQAIAVDRVPARWECSEVGGGEEFECARERRM